MATGRLTGGPTTSGAVEVRYGVYRWEWPVADWSVGRVKSGLKDRWNIHFFSAAEVNGRAVTLSAILRAGDRLIFKLPLGRKGATNDLGGEADLILASHPELLHIAAEVLALGLARERSVEVAMVRAARFVLDRFGPPADAHRLLVGQLLARVAQAVERVADRLDPPPADIVDTPWVAGRLGCTTTWIADLARRGTIPAPCVVPGSGHGKVWRFYRMKIERWLESR